MKDEVWKDINGYEGLYQISNFGRVKRLAREVLYKDGRKYNYKEKIMNDFKTHKGYSIISFTINNNSKWYYIHRIVAEAFIPNLENKPQVNHKDGNKLNNNVENLEWCTNSENITHAYKNNLMSNNKRVFQYDLNGNYIKEWNSIREAQMELKLNHIYDVCSGKRKKCGNYIWKYVE